MHLAAYSSRARSIPLLTAISLAVASCMAPSADDAIACALAPEEPPALPLQKACGDCVCPEGCFQTQVCTAWQTSPSGYIVDVKLDNYLFVHGSGSGPGTFDAWYNYSGMLAVRDLSFTVWRASLANGGTGELHQWVTDLASTIATKQLADRSLVVITHSFGAIAVECLLEVAGGGNCSGFGPASSPTIVSAAAKIKTVHTVQAAHGACGDNTGYLACLYVDLGICEPLQAMSAISGDDLNIDMFKVTAGGAVAVNHVRASAPGDCWFCDECEGGEAFDLGFLDPSTGDLCSDSDSHDGYTEDEQHQDSGRFPGGYGRSPQAPGITASSRHRDYCHWATDDHPSYIHGAARVRDVVGRDPPCVSWAFTCVCDNPGGGPF